MNEKERLRRAVKIIKNLQEELRPIIMDAIHFYVEQEIILCKGTGKHHGYGLPSTPKSPDYKWSIDADSGNSLDIEWNENWRYGGHDGGTFNLTWDFILDEEVRQQYEKDVAEKCEISIKKQKEQALVSKLKQYEKLKQELGDAV